MKIAVIGGGPAGMLAACFASNGAEVTLFEKNEKLGKKLYITGKGRCNLTNDCNEQEFLSNVVTNPKFLYSAIYNFPPQDVVEFFSSCGLATKVERGGRVFPVSDKASDVTKALEKKLSQCGVKVRLSCRVSKIEKVEDSFEISFNGEKLFFDRVIVATGGLSYQATGSTGDGYIFADKFGLKVVQPKASLVEIYTQNDFSALAGLSLKNVTFTVNDNSGKQVFQQFGEMLFTHKGVSGPIVLSASAHLNKLAFPLNAEIDLKSALTNEQLDARIVRDVSQSPNKDVENMLCGLVPSSLAQFVLQKANVNGLKQSNSLTSAERDKLVSVLKSFTLTLTSLAPINEAIVTSGGVATSCLTSSTMESKSIKGLYFAGEVIDVDAYTGGFNMQIAFCTAKLAGENASKV